GGDSRDGRGGNHGNQAPRSSDLGRTVSPGEHPDGERADDFKKLFAAEGAEELRRFRLPKKTVMRAITRFLAVVVCTSFLRAGDNWPQYRGPNGDGHSDSKGLPLTWSETENVKWKTPVHGKAWSCPVIWGNQVWLTTATEDGHELFVVCVDR